jgi:hypothetical protein
MGLPPDARWTPRWLQQMKEARLCGPSLPVIAGAQTETGGISCKADSLSKDCANRRVAQNASRTPTPGGLRIPGKVSAYLRSNSGSVAQFAAMRRFVLGEQLGA